MTGLTRRRFGALTALSAVSAAVPLRYAHAAEFTFKCATNVPETHPLNVYLRKAAEAVKTQTDGRFELQLFPNNQLGGDADMFSQLRSGALESFLLSGVNVLSTLVPASAMSGVGFAFKDYDAVWKALDGKVGAYVRQKVAGGGIVAMEKIWDNGFRQITTSSKPIITPDDLKGAKMRVPVSALWTSLFKSLGASPTGINFAEVYSALQTKVVDGQENPLAIISAAKLFEVQKFCSVTNHMWDGWWFLINRRTWEAVPADLREKVATIINDHAMQQRVEIARQNASLRSELAAKGLVFNDVDPAPFRETLQKAGFYAEWKGKFGAEAWSLLEEATGKLG